VLLGVKMRGFDYSALANSNWDSEILSYIAQIREYKGKQDAYLKQKPIALERLVEIAKIQSTDSSNRIEGIGTSNVRLKQLMDNKVDPQNRDEQEIAGYRDILNIIHESYEHMPLTSSIILQLHNYLYSYSQKSYKGNFKNSQNYISEIHTDGSSFIRFIPLEPFETPLAIDMICTSFKKAVDEEAIDPLILIPILICDFLCIHPFIDGNGRVSRLLTTLLLYQSGFMVGRYISIEQKIEKSKNLYYDTLGKISEGWHEEENDYNPFIKYFLMIVLNSYKDLDSRIDSISNKGTSYEIVRSAVSNILGSFTKAQVLELCPTIGSSSVEAALKRLVEERYINRQGGGRSTTYIRNFVIN